MKVELRAGIILAASAIAGCAVGPDYSPPALELPKTFASADQEFSTEEGPANWWHNFQDPQLSSLVEQAVQGSNDVQLAVSRVNEARALRSISFIDLFPVITGAVRYDARRDSQVRFGGFEVGPKETEVYGAGFDASWEVDLFGRSRRAREARVAEEAASIAGLQDALRTVAAEVGRNYFELRGYQHQLAVASRNAELQAESLKVIERKAALGESSELDAARARTLYNSTVASIPPLEAAVAVAVHRIAVLLGREPGALRSELMEAKPLPRYSGPLQIGDPSSVLRRRPDVRAAELNLAAATARIGVVTADLFPRVSVTGTLGVEGLTPSRIADGGGDYYSIAPMISWAAFDLPRVFQRIRVEDARTEGALVQYQQSVITALEDVENALSRFSAEKRRYQALKIAADESAKAARLAEIQYREGAADFLTLLDAQREQLQADGELARSETQLLVGYAGLFKALGGGWQEAAEKPQGSA